MRASARASRPQWPILILQNRRSIRLSSVHLARRRVGMCGGHLRAPPLGDDVHVAVLARHDRRSDPAQQRILLIGEGPLGDVAARTLGEAGALVQQLGDPSDSEIRKAIAAGVDAVMAISRDDRVSLRLALVVEALAPGIRLIVTIYNRDLGAELRRAVPNVRVMSMGDIVAPSLAAACLDEALLSVRIAADAGPRRDSLGCGRLGPASAPSRSPREPGRAARPQRELAPASVRAQRQDAAGRPLRLRADPDRRRAGGRARAARVRDRLVYSATKTIVTVGPNAKLDNGPHG